MQACPSSSLVHIPLWGSSNLSPEAPAQLQGSLAVPATCSVRLLRRIFARAVQVGNQPVLNMGACILLCALMPNSSPGPPMRWKALFVTKNVTYDLTTDAYRTACSGVQKVKRLSIGNCDLSHCNTTPTCSTLVLHLQVQPSCVRLVMQQTQQGGVALQDFIAGQEASIKQYGLDGAAGREGLQVQLQLQEGCARVEALIQQEVLLVKQELLSARLRSPALMNPTGSPCNTTSPCVLLLLLPPTSTVRTKHQDMRSK